MLKKWLVPVVGLGLAAGGCTPGSEPQSVTAFDTVTTLFAKQADFTGAQTFAVTDSIQHLVGEGGVDDISRQHDALVLQRIRDNMVASGWTEIAAPDSANPPDVVIQVGATTIQNFVIEYWPPYWGWYPGWGCPYCYWGWGGTSVYSYTTGTVLMAMLDVRNTDPVAESVPVMWLGALNGVLSSPSNVPQRLVEGIDQAFAQSPYLRK